jgi:hypothetical protein
MKPTFFAFAVVAAGLAGCASDYVPPRPSSEPGPAYVNEMREGRPGMFGDLTWDIDLSGKPKAAQQAAPQAGAAAASVPAMSAAEQEEFKKWRESAGASERQEFEDWRAWQEWKRKNPK